MTHARRTLIPALAATAVSAAVLALPAGASAPGTVTATPLPASSPRPYRPAGTRVRNSTLGVRVFLDARQGFALANGLSLADVTYPAATTDGGRTWRIDGPELHRPAADGPDGVTQVGAGGRSTYFAYAGPDGGDSVAVTPDRGRHWFRAYLGGVSAVVARGDGALIAFTGSPGVYWSHDGGRTWHHARSAERVP
jgi:hypothetical protein